MYQWRVIFHPCRPPATFAWELSHHNGPSLVLKVNLYTHARDQTPQKIHTTKQHSWHPPHSGTICYWTLTSQSLKRLNLLSKIQSSDRVIYFFPSSQEAFFEKVQSISVVPEMRQSAALQLLYSQHKKSTSVPMFYRQEIFLLATDTPYSSSVAELCPPPEICSGPKSLTLQAQLL